MTEQKLLRELSSDLYHPAVELWEHADSAVTPAKRDEVDALLELGTGAVIVPIDTDWKIPTARVVVVMESVQPNERPKVFELGSTNVTHEYRTTLLQACRVVFGDVDERQGEVHARHQAGEVLLSLVVDLERRALRFVATLTKNGHNICLCEVESQDETVLH